MPNKPVPLSSAEMQEIAAIREVREMWGAEDAAEMAERLDADLCAVKFPHYMTDGPGYGGELFLIMGGALEAPVILIRKAGELIVFPPQ